MTLPAHFQPNSQSFGRETPRGSPAGTRLVGSVPGAQETHLALPARNPRPSRARAAEGGAFPGLRADPPGTALSRCARRPRAGGKSERRGLLRAPRLPPPRPAAPAAGPGATRPAHKITTVRTAAAAAFGELLGRRAFAKRNSPNPRRGRTPIAEVRRLRGTAAGTPAGKPGQGPTCALPHSQIRGARGVPVLPS